MTIISDPTRIFEIRGQVCPLKTAFGFFAVGNNQLVITAVSGKRLKIMGWDCQSDTAVVGRFQLQTAVGGVNISRVVYVPASTSGSSHQLPITNSGYMETVTGDGLYVDVATADVNLMFFYIEYTP